MARLVLFALLLSQGPLACVGQANAPKVFDKSTAAGQGISYATCVLDVASGLAVLGQAGLYINQARLTCQKKWSKFKSVQQNLADTKWTDVDSQICSVSVNQVLYSFSFAIAFFASSASNCARTVNVPAYCVADIANFVGDLEVIAAVGSHMNITCNRDDPPAPKTLEELKAQKLAEKAAKEAAEVINSKTRRLDGKEHHANVAIKAALESNNAAHDRLLDVMKSGKHLVNKAALPGPAYYNSRAFEKDTGKSAELAPKFAAEDAAVTGRQNEQAQCAFNIVVTTAMLARAATALAASVVDCGGEHVASQAGKMLCAVNVAGFESSLSLAAGSLALATAQCPVGQSLDFKLDAGCAFDIAALVSAVAGLATSGASFALTCGNKAQELMHNRRLDMLHV